jgi:cytochrome c6
LVLLCLAAAGGAAQSADPAEAVLGRRLFTRDAVPACAVCHTLKDAGTEGAVGPVLDELKPSAERVAAALRNGIGVMPSYQGSLTEAQILALARYVSTASGAAPLAATGAR